MSANKLGSIDLNPEFSRAVDLMENTDKNMFITGKAGTGKSTLLEYFCKSTKKKPVVLAPTGVAALNVKGQTIHSFFNFYVDVTPEKIAKKKTKPRNEKLYKKLKTIIIDEVSMVRADLLDCIDIFLRIYGPEKMKPFGGVQMVFVGDLYQLPPVVSGEEKQLFSTHYMTPFFFSAHIMSQVKLEIIELEKVYRQKDEAFVGLLNRIRNNSVGNRFEPTSSMSSLQMRLKRVREKVAGAENITFYSFRHNIRTELSKAKKDRHEISHFMGHRSLESQEAYGEV